jgi:alanine dehydrogenase
VRRAVIVGKAKGRTDDKQIAFFSNNEGTGVQFAAVGSVIISRLEKTGFAGIDKIPLDWFLQDIPD